MNPTTRQTENARQRCGSGVKSASGPDWGRVDPDGVVVATGQSSSHGTNHRESIAPGHRRRVTPRGYQAYTRPVAAYTGTKDDYLARLRRIEGQVRGLQRMVDEDIYCIDVLTQVAAVTKALQAVSLGLLEDHVAHCVVDAARTSDEAAQEKVREAAAAIARLVRS